MKIIRRLIRRVFISKTALFIWGLIFCQSFVEFGLVSVLMDDLTNILEGNIRKSAIVVNLQDGLSSIFAIVIHLSSCYAGRFNVIIFCTACYVTGLLLFWLSAWTSKQVGLFCVVVVLIALGTAGKPLPGIFLKYQIKEKLKRAGEEEQSRDDKNERSEINPEQQSKDERREVGDMNQQEQQIGGHEIEEINVGDQENGEDKKESREANIKLRRDQHKIGGHEMEEINLGDRENGEVKKESRETDTKLRRDKPKIGGHEIEEINLGDRQNGEYKKEGRETNTKLRREDEKREPGDTSLEEHQNGDHEMKEIKPDPKMRQRQQINTSFSILGGSAYLSGILLSVFLPEEYQYPNIYKLGALLMAAAYLLFYSGSFCYSFEEPLESPLRLIYKVFKAALAKLDLKYPTSYQQYHWNDYEVNREDLCYRRGRSVERYRLNPHVPSLWRWLDKAAIMREKPDSNQEMQVEKGELCTVKEVIDVKHFSSIIHLSFIFLPYSLVIAAAKTFFVEQASNMKSDFPVTILFVVKAFTITLVTWLFDGQVKRKRFERKKVPGKRYKKRVPRGEYIKKKKFHGKNVTIMRIGAGIACAMLCCLTAWQVELHRLSLTKKEGNTDKPIPMSIGVLIPQFLLLGLMEGLAGPGLKIYYSARLPQSLHRFVEPFGSLMLGIGKLLTIPCIFVLHRLGWFKDTMNESHLDRYFLMLGIVNIVSLCVYVYYSFRYSCKQDFPKDPESLELVDEEQIMVAS